MQRSRCNRRDVDEGHVANICQHSRFSVCASCKLKDRTTAAGFLFAGDPLFTGAMSVAEKTERDPENGDQENGESSKKSKSGNFLDPMKVFIHNVVKWVGTAEAPCSVTGNFSFTNFCLCANHRVPEVCCSSFCWHATGAFSYTILFLKSISRSRVTTP